MPQRRWLLLLLVLCAFAGPAFGQTLSFIDGTGNPASVVLEQDRAWLRVTDPAADLDGSQNTVEVDLTSQEGGDAETVTLTETGGTTGVFEGSLALSIEPSQIENGALETGQIPGSTSRADVVEASYGAAAAEADVVVSFTELLDDQGNPVGDPGYGVGSRITVRVRSHHANTNPQQRDWVSIGLYASGGDAEVLTAQETGFDTSVYESWAYGVLSDGSFAVADGTFEVLPGETLEARVSDANRGTISSDTTTFTAILVEWIDEQGNPATTYLEMSRAYIRATDATANTDPSTAETVLVHTHSEIGMDSQWVTLTETGPATGVFEGWIDLGIGVCCPPIEEELDTGVRVENFQVEWDTLELTYGLADDFATTIGSYTYLLDEQGNPADTYPMGSTIHIRVHEQANNNTADVESVTVDLRSQAGGFDWERVTLTETGGDTGVFEGSIQTVESSGSTAFDGVFEIPSLASFDARHDNRTAGYSYDTARMLSSTPRSVQFVDDSGQPEPFVYEFRSARVKVTDGSAAGQGQLQVRITSELGGDTETVFVYEEVSSPGTFFGSVFVASGVNGSAPDNGVIETTEWNGPPHRFDTLRAALLCAGSPCPDVAAATVDAVGSTTRLTDENGADVISYPVGSAVRVEVQDYGIWDGPAQVTLTTTGGDSEPMSLEVFSYWPRIFGGSIPSESGPPVPGDGRLQVQGVETLVATHANAQTPFSSSDSAILGGSTLDFLDRSGNAVDYQLADGSARVRAVHPAGNVDPGVFDTLTATIESKDFSGNVRDTETLVLTETGSDTGIFTGQIELQTSNYAYPGDGILQTWYSYPAGTPVLDSLTVTLDAEQKTVPLLYSRARFLDSAGADATQYFVGDPIRIQVESETDNQYPYPDYTYARIESLTTGDVEYVALNETGPDTSIFEGQTFSSANPSDMYDGIFSVQAGETIRLTHGEGSSDEATILQNQPPVAGADSAELDEDTWVTIPVLANDSDPEGYPLSLAGIAVEPAHGQTSIEPDGTIRYTPASNYSGADSFQYEISDGYGESLGTVTITIRPFNDPPDSLSLTETTPEDTALRFAFQGSDPDGDPVALNSFTSPTSGQLSLDPDGVTFVYTPAPSFNGSVSFTYDTQDPSGATGTSSVIINVIPVQDPPVAVNDEATTAEDTLVSIYVRDNDSDADGDTIWISNVTQGAHGQVGASATYINYQAAANYYGTDSFTYTINDGNGNYATATVTVTITPVQDPPTAVNDSASTVEDTPVTVAVLANDSDVDGDAISLIAVTQGFNGSVVINADGTATYTPNPNYNDIDRFDYTIRDSNGNTATGRVNLTITAVNDPPNAVDDTATTQEDRSVPISVRSNDSDVDGNPLSVTAVTQGAHGSVTFNSLGVTYTPAANYNGTDSFTYTLSDGRGGTDTATVTVTITPVQDPPVAVNDSATTPEETPVVVDVLVNDTDPDGDPLIVYSVTQGANGSVTFNPNYLTYAPNVNFTGTDSFTYTVRDSANQVRTATVTVTVTGVNDPPAAANDSATTPEDTAVAIPVLSNDVDVDGDSLAVFSVTQGAHGTVTFTGGDGEPVTYTPNANFNGSDSFTYRLSDGMTTFVSATVTVTVTPVNDPPVVVNDTATTLEDTPVTIDVLANDSDPDGDALTVVSYMLGGGAQGTLTLNPDKTLTYTPALNYNGNLGYIMYQASDGSAQIGGVVSLSITPVNDPPAAQDDSATATEDIPVWVFVLGNDSDPDNHPLAVTAVTQGANGSVTFEAGSVTYTPNANFNGWDSFTYTIDDGIDGTATATVSITVSATNDDPVAANDSKTTAEDTATTISVLTNDNDLDGDELSVTAVTQGANGSVTFGTRFITYAPAANFNGSDSFTYTIGDGNGGTATATVTVNVTPENDAPVAVADAVTTNEDLAALIHATDNDSDPDGDPFDVTEVTQPANGTAFIDPGLYIRYTPRADFHGTDSFVYRVTDSTGLSSTAQVTVTVSPVADPPEAADDAVTTNEDTAVGISILANDRDGDGDTLSISSVTQPGFGSVAINADRTVTYTPQANYNGNDTFTYTLSDGNGGTDTARVDVTVTAVNDPPVANDDSMILDEDTYFTTEVLANDTDVDGGPVSRSVTAVTQGAHGTVVINPDNTVTYTPQASYNGSDSFTYTVSDGIGTDTATVSVTVNPRNDAPVAANDSGTTSEDTTVTISVLTNDSDLDGDTLSITAATSGAKGAVTFNVTSVTYTPAANANGSDSFTYTVSDGNGGTATATVSITISAANDSPVAGNDSRSTNEDTAVTISVLTNDSDPDGDTLSISAVTQGAKGAVTFNASSVTYTPVANANGSDSFTYTVSDGNGGSANATVSITINAANDAPDAVNDSAATNEDTAVTISVLSNDTDVDGEALTIIGVTQGTRGSVVQNANGTVTYTPNPNTFGSDTFTYTVRDAAGLTDTATVSVNVVAVNDPPDAVNDSATTTEGTGVVITVFANDTDLEGNALTVTAVSTPAHGTATKNANNTISYVPVSTYSGSDTFTYTISDGTDTDTATVTVQIKDVIGNVAVLGTHSVWIQAGADVLSGDVIANDAGSAPFLNGTELSIAGTTAAGWDVQGNRVTIASGAGVASDVYYNQISGTSGGAQYTPLSLPVFATLPAFQSASPGSTDVNVANNGNRTLAPGSYRDLIVGRRGTVTFTGGTYHFRSIRVDREAKLLFSAGSTVRVQQKMSTSNLTTIGPSAGSSATAASIIFHVGGVNGTGGGLAETPKAVEIGVDNTVSANLYAPNGTIWLKDRTQATGAYIGRDVQVGVDGQVTLSSAW
ncbi:MAG TPA: Ig-like domain-containing protein [Thermoanaerobaculia bacterium]